MPSYSNAVGYGAASIATLIPAIIILTLLIVRRKKETVFQGLWVAICVALAAIASVFGYVSLTAAASTSQARVDATQTATEKVKPIGAAFRAKRFDPPVGKTFDDLSLYRFSDKNADSGSVMTDIGRVDWRYDGAYHLGCAGKQGFNEASTEGERHLLRLTHGCR